MGMVYLPVSVGGWVEESVPVGLEDEEEARVVGTEDPVVEPDD